MRLAVIIPAAGGSTRFRAAGGLRSKLEEDLGGKPLIQRTVEVFTKFDDDDVTITSIIVAGPHAEDDWREFRERHQDRLSLLGATLVRGGTAHRFETVREALTVVPGDATHVAVHDAARPCVGHALLTRVFRAARFFPAVVPALPASDTIKRTRETGDRLHDDDPAAAILGMPSDAGEPLRDVVSTLDRAGLVLVQTPQVFDADLFRRAYAQPDLASTDDAALVERLGERVVVVEGEPRNIKITWPDDVAIARALLGFREPEGRPTHKKF